MTQALAPNTSSRTGISDLFGNRLFSTLANQSLLVSALTAFQLLLLLFALKVNKHLLWVFPQGWVLLPIFLCITLSTVRIRTEEKIIVRLWQLIGIFSATYSLLHYPLFPPMPNNLVAIGTYAFVLMLWLISASGGMFSFYLPSLAVLPPAFLVWCNRFAETITGLPITTDVDIMPLNEVSICRSERQLHGSYTTDRPRIVVNCAGNLAACSTCKSSRSVARQLYAPMSISRVMAEASLPIAH